MAEQTIPNSHTVAIDCIRVSPDHPHLFRVNPGVNASIALANASLLLAAAHAMTSDHAENNGPVDAMWGVACLIEMARSVVDSVSNGLVRTEVKQ